MSCNINTFNMHLANMPISAILHWGRYIISHVTGILSHYSRFCNTIFFLANTTVMGSVMGGTDIEGSGTGDFDFKGQATTLPPKFLTKFHTELK